MGSTAKRAAVVTLVAGSLIVLALALWKIKVVIALIFLGFIVAAAMRPGVDWLHRRARVPRGGEIKLRARTLDLGVRCFRPPEPNVLGNRRGKHHRVLRHQRDASAQFLRVGIADSHAIEPDRAR